MMLVHVTVFCALLIPVLTHHWEAFKIRYNKTYPNREEHDYRRQVYTRHFMAISRHNAQYHLGLKTYFMAMNKFGDLTDLEFERQYLMPPYYNESSLDEYLDESPINLENVPRELDWRRMGAVTAVKDQNPCGSCYAFSAVGALESQHYLAITNLVSLSEQNIIDCTYLKSPYFNCGCRGGNIEKTFKYIIDRGVDTAKSYPYKAKVQNCNFKRQYVGATMTKFVKVTPNDEAHLKVAVAKIGPISVMVDGSKMKFYSGGVFDEPTCGKRPNHGLVVVGYNSTRAVDYWVVKNSWGVNWGQEGYILMARNKGNQCGIASQAIYPIVQVLEIIYI